MKTERTRELYFFDTLLIGIIGIDLNIKARLLSTCPLKSLLMLNPGFYIYPTWNWLLFFLFNNYHRIIHMPKINTIVCTQQIPQWYLFAIFPLFRCLNFHICFLCLNHFLIKVQDICQCKTNNLVFWKCNIIKCLISVFVSYESL